MLNNKVKTFDDIKTPIVKFEDDEYKLYQGIWWNRNLQPFEKPGTPLDMQKIKEDQKALEDKGKWYNQNMDYKAKADKLEEENEKLNEDVLKKLDIKEKKKKHKNYGYEN